MGLGSNLGDREGNLRTAIARLEEICGPLNVAPFYSTAPISSIAQPEYLNTVAIAPCSPPQPSALIAARALLERIKGLEREIGRRPGARFGPRILDIDLLLFGNLVHQDPEPPNLEDRSSKTRWLVLPHPRMHQRRFVLAPLNDLVPHLELPPDGVPVHELLARLGEEQAVTRFR